MGTVVGMARVTTFICGVILAADTVFLGLVALSPNGDGRGLILVWLYPGIILIRRAAHWFFSHFRGYVDTGPGETEEWLGAFISAHPMLGSVGIVLGFLTTSVIAAVVGVGFWPKGIIYQNAAIIIPMLVGATPYYIYKLGRWLLDGFRR